MRTAVSKTDLTSPQAQGAQACDRRRGAGRQSRGCDLRGDGGGGSQRKRACWTDEASSRLEATDGEASERDLEAALSEAIKTLGAFLDEASGEVDFFAALRGSVFGFAEFDVAQRRTGLRRGSARQPRRGRGAGRAHNIMAGGIAGEREPSKIFLARRPGKPD